MQYIGDQFPGLAGLKAGSQPVPGIYVTLPLYYRDSQLSIYDRHGTQVLKEFTAAINVIALPSAAVVTPLKMFGASYGASQTEWLINGVVNVAALNFQRSTNYGFGDIYVQPATLGWLGDATLGYAFFVPTGSGSSGQHMWVNEIDAGATLYLDERNKWNISRMSYYDFNRKKNNQFWLPVMLAIEELPGNRSLLRHADYAANWILYLWPSGRIYPGCSSSSISEWP